MKKILVILVLMIAMVMPMFAVEATGEFGTAGKKDAQLTVYTNVGVKSFYGFTKEQYTGSYSQTTSPTFISSEEQLVDYNGKSFWATVVTNSVEKLNVTLTLKDNLKKGSEEIETYLEKVSETTSGKVTKNGDVEMLKETDSRKAPLVYSGEFKVSYKQDDFNKVSAGKYSTTITMTIKAVN